MPILLILFVLSPLLELYVLIQVGAEIGALPTIGLSLFTAFLGGWLVRRQGFQVIARIQEASARGEVPALEMLDGALLLIAGLSLLLPGFITDLLGFLLLVPAFRQRLILRTVRPLFPEDLTGRPGAVKGILIEGECRRERD